MIDLGAMWKRWQASERIARAVAWRLDLGSRPADWEGPEMAETIEPMSRRHV